ncbi:MAG: MFS transporter [Thermotogae bacterium]|uniref:MFS transporter n=1 Tax=Kosmotoga sp. TaxID=1955248 RepID=UPI000F1ECEFE|nr:MFS transporter [Kosmotoga sp.]MBO8166405.1 MFS transporter [Kosmotoga sp.]RKX50775.1 MAG: MFS transporter [Thermotogota bacterium]
MKNYLKNFWLYAAGRFVSLIGSGVQYLALSLYILDITGSGTMMGTFLVVSMLPRVIFAPFAGVVGDRFNRKKIMVYLDFARGVLIFLLAFIAYKGMLSLVVIYISQLLISTLDIFFDPATGAMVPDIVPKEKLTRANSILGSINSFSYIIGPAVGGILYPLGIGIVFILNASSFIASGISEMFIEYKQTTEKKKMTARQFFEDFKGGLAFLKNRSDIFLIMTFAMITNFLMAPVFMVVMPYFARTVVGFSSQQYGILNSTWVVGGLIGNLLIASFLSRTNPGKLFDVGLFGQIGAFFVFNVLMFPMLVKTFGGASWMYLGVLSVSFIVAGTLNAFINTPLNVFFQRTIPTEVRSRAFSVLSVLSQLIVPLGTALFGFLVDRMPAHYLVLVALSLTIGVTIPFLATGKLNVLKTETEG